MARSKRQVMNAKSYMVTPMRRETTACNTATRTKVPEVRLGVCEAPNKNPPATRSAEHGFCKGRCAVRSTCKLCRQTRVTQTRGSTMFWAVDCTMVRVVVGCNCCQTSAWEHARTNGWLRAWKTSQQQARSRYLTPCVQHCKHRDKFFCAHTVADFPSSNTSDDGIRGHRPALATLAWAQSALDACDS